MKHAFVLFCCAFVVPLQGTVFLDLNPTELISCTLSSEHHNRMVISGKRIKKVIYPDKALLVKIEDETGQVYLESMVEDLQNVTVSLITTDGIAQDLELHFAERSSEIVILQVPEEKEMPNDENAKQIQTSNEYFITCLVNEIVAGRVPDGYGVVDQQGKPWCVGYGVSAQKIYELLGNGQTIHVMCVQNKSNRKKCLHESLFQCPGVEWIYLDRHQLKPGEKTFAIISWRDR